MTPVTQAATTKASSQVNERKEITILLLLTLSHPLLQSKVMKGDASFVVVLCITGPNAQQEIKGASNVALKVTLENCVGRRKALV